jgi:hypothetical protein
MAPAAVNPATVLDRVDDDAALRLTRAMIRIPGVSPPGDEAIVAEGLAGFLEEGGLAVEVIEGLPGRPNVLATAQLGDGGPTVLLNGHTDSTGRTSPRRGPLRAADNRGDGGTTHGGRPIPDRPVEESDD